MILLLLLLLLLWGAVISSAVSFIAAQWKSEFEQQQQGRLRHIGFSVANVIRESRNRLDKLVLEAGPEALLDIDTPEKLEKNRQNLQRYYDTELDLFTGNAVVLDFRNGRSYTNNPFIKSQTFIDALQLNISNILHLFQTRQMAYEFIGLNPKESSSAFAKYEKFCLVKPLPSSSDGSIIGMIFITFDRQVFRNTTGISVLDGTSEFVLLNYRNEPFLATRDMFLPQVIRYDSLGVGLNGQYNLSERGDKIQLYADQPQAEGYRCVLATQQPTFHFFEMKGAVSVTALGVAALLLLLYFLLSYIRKSRSIIITQNLLENREDNILTKSLLSDKRTLQNIVAKEMLNLRTLEEKVNRSIVDMRHSALTGLILGNAEPFRQAENLKELGLAFPYESFDVMTFRCKELQKLGESQRAKANQEWKLLEFVVQNIVSEYHKCAAFTYQNSIVAIVNLKPGGKEPPEVAELICTVCKNELNTELTAGVGRPAGDPAHISGAYQDSVFAADQAAAMGKRVLCYSDAIKLAVPEQDYARLIEIQYYLINACKTQNWEDAVKLFDTICQKIFSENLADVSMVKVQILDIMNAVVQQVHGDRCFLEKDTDALRGVSVSVMECSGLEDIRKGARAFAGLLSGSAGRVKEKQSMDFVHRVHEIVDSQYQNIDLSVAYIADLLGQPSKALSAAYKQKTGRGLLDTIHSKRIEEAKKLLEQTDKSIVEISALTGYENVNTFIRVFKRYCGMTPGGYRDSAQS